MLSKKEIKDIQSLFHKNNREEHNLFIAEGPKIVTELIAEKNVVIKKIYALPSWLSENNCKEIESVGIIEAELSRISQNKSPNKVIAIVEKISWKNKPGLEKTISLALDGIQDPGNLGTIIRLADWFGIKQIFCSNNCATIYNNKVIQASMGSIARVRVEYVALEKLLNENLSIKIYAATLDGKDVSKIEKLKEGIILIGNESKGIRKELIAAAHQQIKIVGKGNVESLNAAVATGILLFHLT